ncbi:PIN domain-containing protein [Anaerolineales bacterium HSG25]|nr:PIN domain-containing protein [Anaerolineales bacterium HSG25]
MRVLVDTNIWSLALRRRQPTDDPAIQELTRLIQQTQVVMLGVIRQEILSGIREVEQFERLRTKLWAFPDFPLTTDDFETAAQFFNQCRAKGIQGSNTDFLLCAVSYRHNFPIFTQDRDFEHFQKHLSIRLHRWE